MPTKPDIEGAELDAFIRAAGDSLSAAQGKLAAGLDIQSDIMLSNADLEVKAAIKTDSQGRLTLQTISAQEIRQGGINPESLSTLRISFVATAADVKRTAPPSAQPKRSREEVIQLLQKRTDVSALAKILGGLEYDAVYVSESERWLVTAKDSKGSVVREAILPD